MVKKGDKVVDEKKYHLRRDERMPRELTNFSLTENRLWLILNKTDLLWIKFPIYNKENYTIINKFLSGLNIIN